MFNDENGAPFTVGSATKQGSGNRAANVGIRHNCWEEGAGEFLPMRFDLSSWCLQVFKVMM